MRHDKTQYRQSLARQTATKPSPSLRRRPASSAGAITSSLKPLATRIVQPQEDWRLTMTTAPAEGHATEHGSALHIAGKHPADRPAIAHSHTAAKTAARPTVSLVIPVRNEARNIAS